jgi:hypothetical protein
MTHSFVPPRRRPPSLVKGTRGGLGVLLGVALLVAPGHAQERETRIDLFDTRSNRTGSAIIDEKSGRVDFYDKSSNRTGYGTIDKNGRIDLYDRSSNRTGSGQVVPGTTRPRGRSK